jgi:Cdc6-like AAA superfamily ATPase
LNAVHTNTGSIEQNTSFILLIEGEAGTGKTLMLREIENQYFRRPSFTSKGQLILPIIIKLSEIKELSKCLEETMKRTLKNDFLVENILEKGKKLDKGQSDYVFLILFDGFDELKKPVNLYDMNELDQYECIIIYTSRPESSKNKDHIGALKFFLP